MISAFGVGDADSNSAGTTNQHRGVEMYYITTAITTLNNATHISTVALSINESPYVKYVEILNSVEELFDRHSVLGYDVYLAQDKELIVEHKQKANVH